MSIIFWIIFVLVLAAGLFYYGKCELLEEKNYKLEDELYETKQLEHRTELMLIKDWYDAYKKEKENPYKVLAEIGNIINKTVLDSNNNN